MLISFNVVIIGVDKGVIIKLNGKIADEGNIMAGEHGMGTLVVPNTAFFLQDIYLLEF